MSKPIDPISAARELALSATKNVEDMIKQINQLSALNPTGVPMELTIGLAQVQAACATAWANIALAEQRNG